ncbi:MAG: Reeler domain-containing protein [Bacteroidia bacterium]
MKNKITISLLILCAGLVISASRGKSSSGAPASHTGAPDEQTCATSGCHDDNNLNSGKAKFHVRLGENINSVESGKTYPITIQIIDENVTRFGFQIVALNENNENAGKFEILDKVRTQFVKNEYKLKNRQYVTYTFNGTDAVTEGKGEWQVNWTAPSELKGKITFYASAVSANDDMHDTGDIVYTYQLSLTAK